MTDFGDALRKGFAAHRDATRAKNEIWETFRELSTTVSELTDQKVFVEAGRTEKSNILYPLAAMVQRTAEFVWNQLPEPELPDALFAVRHGAEHAKRSHLCRLSIGVNGYPVEITITGHFLHATDRESLRAALVEVLQHPDVAGKIARVSELRGTLPESLPSGTGGDSVSERTEALDPEARTLVAALLQEVADEAGPSASQRTAQLAMPWLDAGSQADRQRGYRLISEGLQREEELDPAVRAHLRGVALDPGHPYGDRGECVRLLRYSDRFEDGDRSILADLWFEERDMPTAFSSALSAVFERRSHLPPLLRALGRVSLPPNDEAAQSTDIASHGYRIGQAFGSVLGALQHDKAAPLAPELSSQIRALLGRYKDISRLAPLLRDIAPFVTQQRGHMNVTEEHQRPSPGLTIATSSHDRSYWISRPYITAEIRDSVSRADIVAVPLEGFREHSGPLFPVGMESILPFIRKELPAGIALDVCVDDEHYHELALHGLILQLGIWLATAAAAPLLVNILSEYIKNRKKAVPDESTVRFRLLLQQKGTEGVVALDYDGPSDVFKETVGTALERYLAGSSPPAAPEATNAGRDSGRPKALIDGNDGSQE